MTYMDVKISDLIVNNVLQDSEITWASNVRIPYQSCNGEWQELLRVQKIVKNAIDSGIVKKIKREAVQVGRGPQIISDYIAGPGGAVQSQADGKMYDSKSSYYKSVKAAGCEVLGTDAPREAVPMEAKICENDLKRDIAQAIEQLGG